LGHARYMSRSHNGAFAILANAPENVGRFLLVLAAVELISMPLTQYAWNWDHFLHGGIDFESSLLFLVIGLGLLIVLRYHCRQDKNSRVPRWRLSSAIFDTAKSATMFGAGVSEMFHRECRASSDFATYNLPLQI
jgi:hypothetical protein